MINVRSLCAAVVIVVLPVAAAQSQTVMCPAGSSPAVVRMSKVAAGGTLEGVKAAMALHQKWYADHGFAEDRILFEPVVVPNPETHTLSVLPDQFITLHLHTHEVPADKRDAGWDAFTAAYKKNSELISTTMTCLP